MLPKLVRWIRSRMIITQITATYFHLRNFREETIKSKLHFKNGLATLYLQFVRWYYLKTYRYLMWPYKLSPSVCIVSSHYAHSWVRLFNYHQICYDQDILNERMKLTLLMFILGYHRWNNNQTTSFIPQKKLTGLKSCGNDWARSYSRMFSKSSNVSQQKIIMKLNEIKWPNASCASTV